MKLNTGPQSLGELFDQKKDIQKPKPPAYQWQDLALQVIDKLRVPGFKRNSVFKVCKEYPREFVEQAVATTLELCTDGAPWKYFFKVIDSKNKEQLDQKI